MDELYLLVPLGCAAFGIVMSLLLLVLLRRQTDRPKEYLAGSLLAISVLLMYASVTIWIRSACAGLPHENGLFLLNEKIFLTLATIIPPIVLLTWKWSSVFEEGSPVGRTLFRAALASSLIIIVLIWFGSAWLFPIRRIEQIVVLNAAVILCSGYRGVLKQKLSRHLRLCMLLTRAFYLIGLAAALFIPRSIRFSWMSFASLLVIQQSFILAGIIGSFIFIARFRFADVFVKWSVRVAGLGLIAIVGATGLAFLPESMSRFNTILLDAACLFLLIGLAIVAVPIVDWWSERWLLQQADLKGELARIGTDLQGLGSERELLSFVDQRLVDSLQVAAARTTLCKALPDAVVRELSTFGDVVEPSAGASLQHGKSVVDIELLVPVVVDGDTRYAITIRTGPGRRALLSGEVKFLRAIAGLVGARIHHIEAGEVAQQQALRESLLRNQLTEAELRALRAQVNPHFLFNSLNTIADLIVTNPVNAERMTLRLASIFRHVLAQSDRQFMTLREEFEFLQNYLQIEQERFGDRLNVNLSLDPVVMHERVPTLLLQPIVENALRHGLAPKGGKGLLEIQAARHGNLVELLIRDDGIGYQSSSQIMVPSVHRSRGSGLGLVNTAARLQTIYGGQASLSIDSVPAGGCSVTISYPLGMV